MTAGRRLAPSDAATPPPHPLFRSEPRGRVHRLAPTGLRALLDAPEPPLLLDVRPPAERALGHLPGDLAIPFYELPGRLAEVPSDRAVVVYCHFGGTADRAAALLGSAGRSNVAVLEGGIDEYARLVDPTLPRYDDDPSRPLVLQQFPNERTGCLAYLLSDRTTGDAVVVDPGVEVEPYLRAIRARGLRLRAIVETHTHADHRSGHAPLHERTDAPIWLGRRSPAQYPHRQLADGDRLAVGGGEIVVAETPGHTLDHLALRASGFVFTGDTLLPGSCGRTDLGGDPDLLWESLQGKLLALPDETEVFPAHYGALHGLPPPSRYSSTIGFERRTNEALAQPDRAAFLRYMTEGWPPKPADFDRIVHENLIA